LKSEGIKKQILATDYTDERRFLTGGNGEWGLFMDDRPKFPKTGGQGKESNYFDYGGVFRDDRRNQNIRIVCSDSLITAL
jgi:hypothetical protein